MGNLAIKLLKQSYNLIKNNGSVTVPLRTGVSPIFRGNSVEKAALNGVHIAKPEQTHSALKTFLKGNNPEIEKAFKEFDFSKFGREGIPLKYSRQELIQDIVNSLKTTQPEKAETLLKKFNLTIGYGDLDGIPNLAVNAGHSTAANKIRQYLEKFCKNNETTISDKNAKKALDSIIKDFPEFNMTIGKVQHGTHIYSVDVHSLKVLQSAMNNPEYAKLSNESKEVLKLTALIHDFGKKGNIVTPGHAIESRREAELLLKNYDFPQNIKDRVLNQVENHHWFEKYNLGKANAQDIREIFKTPEDLKIAKMLAKGDFESVNPQFHLQRMVPNRILTQEEFDTVFAKKMSEI